MNSMGGAAGSGGLAGTRNVGDGSMAEFREAASRATRAAKKVSSLRGFAIRDLDKLRHRLTQEWIFQPRAVMRNTGNGRGGVGNLLGDDGGVGGTAFVKDTRERRLEEDTRLALHVAFVLTANTSEEEEEYGGYGVSDSIVSMDIKSRVATLLATARDSHGEGIKYRFRLRALLAVSALANRSLVAEVISTQGGKNSSNKDRVLADLMEYGRHVGYMAEMEEARLPHKIEEVIKCRKEDLVRALWRDHRGEEELLPVLCEMLLDSGCEDTSLWASILKHACRRPGLHRALIMRVLPCVARSPVADAFARAGTKIAPLWEEALRGPLEELQRRDEHRKRTENLTAAPTLSNIGKGAHALGAIRASVGGGMSAPMSFSMSLFGSEEEVDMPNPIATHGLSPHGGRETTQLSSRDRDLPWDDILAVVDQVILLLAACPCPEDLDISWFYTTLMGMDQNFHVQALRAALCVTCPEERVSAVVGVIKGGVPPLIAVEELSPGVGGKMGPDWGIGNQAILEAIYLEIDRQGYYDEFYGTRHFHRMASSLVREGKAFGLVRSCMTSGREHEAEKLCAMHYAAHPSTIPTQDVVKELTELERFSLEFGLTKA
ncbi:unnamed protein product [Choristocarpus tenellus]